MPVGCGRHTAQLVDRGGAVLTEATVLTDVEWTRTLDDASSAKVTILPDGDCCERLAQVRAWRTRLVIYRDGHLVWEGPVLTPTWTRSGVTIEAADILTWLDWRVPHEDRLWADADLATIADWLIRDGFAPDDPGHEVQIVAPTRIRGDREYQRDVGQTGEHLRDLARTGLDFTAVGRRILLMPEDHCERVGSLTDEDFPSGLSVAEDGASAATRWIVHGREGQDDEPDVFGMAGGLDPYYGLLERVVEETSILDDQSAEAAARSRLRGSSPAPTFIDTSQQTTLAPDAGVDVPSLVPGWCVDVTTTTTCRTIRQSLKIQGVTVKETGPAGESVSAQFVPAGA
ncbi:hypothetical protein ACIP5N_32045 [Streptomyces sp. NPDC088768]|uniref:hypothetical protein n=1 Tax=Streptomyces sp. NPDC088768 TaxID=3365894 RepID=UPI0038203C37